MARENFDVIIAGAGPVGAHLACLLSKKGLSVLVLEKKKTAGKTACSGLISTRLSRLVPIENSFIEHIVFGATFHSRNMQVSFEKEAPVAYVINRVLFDRHLVSLARRAGTRISLGNVLETYSVEDDCVIVNKRYAAKVLVGADGAGSTVRRLSGLRGEIAVVNGVISVFEEPEEARMVDIFYGRSIAPGFFAWKIPRGKSVEYGLASSKDHLKYFKKFLAAQNRGLGTFYSHPIVFGNQETAGERVILAGDAALQVKPFSGGGVIYGLLCAKIAARAVIRAFGENDFSKGFFEKAYDAAWKKKLSKPIENGKMLRGLMDSLDDRELDSFFEFLKARAGRLSAFGDMDFLK